MAFLVKTRAFLSGGPSSPGSAVLQQRIHVTRQAKTLPQTAAHQLFRVFGGRILVHLLIGEVTTVIEGTNPVPKISASKLTAGGALSGTAYDIASTLDWSSDEVGTIYTVPGTGGAMTSPQVAGAGFIAATEWICPGPGQIYLTTGANKSGAVKWDLFYEPLDGGAFAVAVDTVTLAIT